MKKVTILLVLSVLVINSCKKPHSNIAPINKALITVDTCLSGFILIEYLGEQSKPIKSLLLRTNKNDSSYYKYGMNKSSLKDNSTRRFVLLELIISKSEFGTIKRFIASGKVKRTNILAEELCNPQQVILVDKCDTITYIVDKHDSHYFKNLIDLIKNDSIRKYLRYTSSVQERE